jgi:hypothetical protein
MSFSNLMFQKAHKMCTILLKLKMFKDKQLIIMKLSVSFNGKFKNSKETLSYSFDVKLFYNQEIILKLQEKR